MQLRPYQQEALDALFAFFATHPDPAHNPVIAMPTGTGKSPVIAEFCHRVLRWWPGQRILMLVHVKELVDQNAATLRRIWPQVPLGVFSAGLGQRAAHMPVTFAGTKSVAKNLAKFGPQDIVVIDECHLIPDEEESEYQKVLAYFRALNPRMRVVGLSATPYRMGLGLITDGSIFSHVCYDITGLTAFNLLLEEGYLSPLIPIQTETVIDVTAVAKRGGEFVAGQLQEAVNREELTRRALTETVRAARDRRHWLIFAAGVDHVEAVAGMLRTEFGVPCAVVHGKLSTGDRDAALASFKGGEVRALVNANILTTGFDMPQLDCIVCLRPTGSVVLHIQMLGRGTRPVYAPGYALGSAQSRLSAMAAGGKRNCLVLDFAGNVNRLGPINDPRIPKRRGEGDGTVPVKLCEECACLNHISARVCDNCGEPFKIQEKITETASTAELIARAEPPKIETFKVQHVVCERYVSKSPGKPPMLQVSYYCGVQRFTELVLLEHYHSRIIDKARDWWRKRTKETPDASGQLRVPASVDEALRLEGYLRHPIEIDVWVNRRDNGRLRPEVRGYRFREEEPQS